MDKVTCSIGGCDRPVKVKSLGWCQTHYMRRRRTGEVNASVPVKPARRDVSDSEITYFSFHRRLRKARGSARDRQCVDCGGKAEQWAWLHDKDPRDFASYVPMCRSCHKKYDATPETREKARRNALAGWAPDGYLTRARAGGLSGG
jgi:hypothetical protein